MLLLFLSSWNMSWKHNITLKTRKPRLQNCISLSLRWTKLCHIMHDHHMYFHILHLCLCRELWQMTTKLTTCQPSTHLTITWGCTAVNRAVKRVLQMSGFGWWFEITYGMDFIEKYFWPNSAVCVNCVTVHRCKVKSGVFLSCCTSLNIAYFFTLEIIR